MVEYEIQFLRADLDRLVMSFMLLPTDLTLTPQRLNLAVSQDTLDLILPMTMEERFVYIRPKVIEVDSAAQEVWANQLRLKNESLGQDLEGIQGMKFTPVTAVERDNVKANQSSGNPSGGVVI